MAKVLGIGNALVDIMTKLRSDETLSMFNLPKGSMQLVDAEFSDKVNKGTDHLAKTIASGGSAANTIHGLAKMGISTGFIGKVGHDDLGRLFEEDMKASGISPLLLKSNTPSGKAMALISPDSERTFATFLGAAVELSAGDLTDSLYKDYDYFHIEGYLVQNHELIEQAVRLAKKNGLKVSLDMASYNVVEDNLEFLQRIVKEYVDIVFANEEEAKSFTGKEPEEAIHVFGELCEIAVVKIGKEGSLIKNAGKLTKVKAINANSIDTTGAGDLYAAGFLYGLINGHSFELCGKAGSILAGRTIEVIGPKMTDENWTEVRKLVSELKN
ncbi:MAG: adenosine kinase [Bacteroidales bacterium]|nr:adenosine kinase [Bacteroidales bacterium]MCF8402573.1 adenosine kinase [Bacteroidales bacterium]